MANLSYWDETYINWAYGRINEVLGNEYGTAALLGNIYAESGIIPFRCEGMSLEESRQETDTTYKSFTNADDFASHYTVEYYIDDELYRGYGYSLAQWTSYGRKVRYWEYVGGPSGVGDGQLSVEYLLYELEYYYPWVFNVLKSATSIKEASDYVLVNYEAPYDQSEEVKEYRASLGNSIYEDFHGKPVPPSPTVTKRKMPVWMMIHRRR